MYLSDLRKQEGGEACQDWAQQARSHSHWSCSDSMCDVGRKRRGHTQGEGCGCAGGDWEPFVLHTACTEPREEKDLLLMLPRVCLPLWESDGGYFL